MAQAHESISNIESAINELTKNISTEDLGAAQIFNLAAAVNQLAEARAWLVTASQPHGGTSVSHG
ncbi:hypothetical protein GCM10009740_31500 [Terrabacter terrae]|uniref:Uncharacterized protein n=1 Tax=Terrabacter terrae TaxID=318434 RepID=A0ABN2UJE1_9MICO